MKDIEIENIPKFLVANLLKKLNLKLNSKSANVLIFAYKKYYNCQNLGKNTLAALREAAQ